MAKPGPTLIESARDVKLLHANFEVITYLPSLNEVGRFRFYGQL